MALTKPSIHVTLFSLFIKKPSVCVISVTGPAVPGFLIKDKALGQFASKRVHEKTLIPLYRSCFAHTNDGGCVCCVVDNEDEEQESTTVRYHPENLEQLQSQTHFSRQELQLLYRGFKNVSAPLNPRWVQTLKIMLSRPSLKYCCLVCSCFCQDCPSGVVNEDTFKNIYALFFPLGGRSTSVCFIDVYPHYMMPLLIKVHYRKPKKYLMCHHKDISKLMHLNHIKTKQLEDQITLSAHCSQ